ncbi:NAD(P)-dependent oxidoreductase [Litorivicinus sp.]|nr:NAD(P)-dependent oxidoreductase [Litorivicinus sp.]
MHTLIVGLGSMGLGAAVSCLKAGISTTGFDVNSDALRAFSDQGGHSTADLESIEPVDAVLLFVVNADQADTVLFDSPLMSKFKPNAVVINCVTVAPYRASDISSRIVKAGFGYLDAPVSGGAVKAKNGQISIMGSGEPETFNRVQPILDAISERIFRLGNEPGAGSQMKLINQLLAGVHIAATAEALNLAASLNMDLHEVIDVIQSCAGTSWMFENRGPHIANGDYTPLSTVNIFVKDLSIVIDEAQLQGAVTPLSQTALSLYQNASDNGLGLEDDSAIVKILAAQSGSVLPGGKQ